MVSDYAMTKRFRGARLHLAMQNPVGASLLAKGPYQATSILNDPPYSRAGSLPHWYGVYACDIGATVRFILSG
jgi:hypothetical protein